MTVYPAFTRGDAIRVELAAVEVPMLAVAGAIPGVVVLAPGGANGPGAGTLRQVATTSEIQWKAPGSANYGLPIDVSAGGSFVLEDGDDASAWVRVLVAPAFQMAGAPEALAHGQEVYNAIGFDDVTEAEAAAGDVSAYTVTLENQSPMEVHGLKSWIDPSTVGIEISDDGIIWVTPTTEGTALALGDLDPGDNITYHLRRTIGAGAPSDPEVLNLLHQSWEGI